MMSCLVASGLRVFAGARLPPDRAGLAVAGLVVAGLVVAGLVMERVDLADAHHGVRRRPAPVRAGGGSESSRSHSLMRRTATGLSRARSEEHTSALQSLIRLSYAVFCLKQKNKLRA